jgi:preprotein translocase subunit Sec63
MHSMHDQQNLMVKQAFTWDTSTPWEVLQVSIDAYPEEIKSNWKKLVQVWHPDHNKEIKDFADEVFKALANAHKAVKYNEDWNPHILNQTIVTSLSKVKENQETLQKIITPITIHSFSSLYSTFKKFKRCATGEDIFA